MTVQQGLTRTELTAWRTFLRAHATIVRALETDLLAEHDLPLASYDVLVQLSEAPDRRLRMTDLAERVLLSRSGLTRLADRLEREGLLRREACPSDARGTLAVLTEAGLDRLRGAWPTHLRGVQERFASRLDADEMSQLGALLAKVVPDGTPR
jgi:DNA-binding MarR family transcriptional regulator